MKDDVPPASKADSGHGEHLTTVGVRDPLKVLEQFGEEPLVVVVAAVEPRHSATGQLEERGEWVRSLWRLALSTLPEAEGCRLSWNTLFFAVAGRSVEWVEERFQEVLGSLVRPSLESLCLLHEFAGSPTRKLNGLDKMLDEISAKRNFGTNPVFRHRLVDGTAWLPS